jgi:hypothetical protein
MKLLLLVFITSLLCILTNSSKSIPNKKLNLRKRRKLNRNVKTILDDTNIIPTSFKPENWSTQHQPDVKYAIFTVGRISIKYYLILVYI